MLDAMKICMGRSLTDFETVRSFSERLYKKDTQVSLGIKGGLSLNTTNSGMVKVYSIKSASVLNIIERAWSTDPGMHSVNISHNYISDPQSFTWPYEDNHLFTVVP